MRTNPIPQTLSAVLVVLFFLVPSVANENDAFLADGENRFAFSPVEAKFVRLELSRDAQGGAPAIDEILVFGPDAPGKNLALAASGAKAGATACIPGYAIHKTEHLIDGFYGNDHCWVADPADPKPVVWVELPQPRLVSAVVFSRDRFGEYKDRVPSEVVLSLSADGKTYFRPENLSCSKTPARLVKPKAPGETAEVYVPLVPGPPKIDGPLQPTRLDSLEMQAEWRRSLVDEEYAWLKAFGRADIDPGLTRTPYPIKRHPLRLPEDATTLVRIAEVPRLDGRLAEPLWERVSNATVRVAKPGTFEEGAAVEYVVRAFLSGERLYLAISTNRLLSAHLAVLQTTDGGGIIAVSEDGKLVWRVYDEKQTPTDLPLEGASAFETSDAGKTARHFECAVPLARLPGIENGLAIRAGIGGRYTPIGGHPVRFAPSGLAVVALDSKPNEPNHFAVRLVNHSDRPLSVEGIAPDVCKLGPHEIFETSLPAHEDCKVGISEKVSNRAAAGSVSARLSNAEMRGEPGADASGCCLSYSTLQSSFAPAEPGELGPERTLTFSVPEESLQGRLSLLQYDPLGRTLNLLEKMLGRVREKGAKGAGEYRNQIALALWRLATLRQKAHSVPVGTPAYRELFCEARKAKRELFFADPEMRDLETILFEKRFPLHPSHNYSDYYDSTWRAGGGIYTLRIPREEGRFVPEKAVLSELFRTSGMCRHPVADFEAAKIYFTNRPSQSDYWHIMEMNPDGSGLRQLTEGPFQDLWPCPLPDGDLAFISTRCRQKFLCWEPQASVLHRMNRDGGEIKRLSFANLTEFAPSVSRDGRILWTRSEYLDKGADYGHTLWYIRPDGVVPELTFGNTIVLPQGYANGREIPGTNEALCVMISHFGDLNGPVAILDIDQGRLNPEAIRSITPEVPWPGFWAASETFREPFPISSDLFLVSHSSRDRFGLFVIDRFGNRELLYIDAELGSMCPTPLRPRPRPPVLASTIDPTLAEDRLGVFTVEDVYAGIEHAVPRGTAKYLRVCQEMPHFLEKYADGTYRSSYQPFMEFYASPVDLVSGPHGWTSYVAKGDLGTVEIEADGSVGFLAPSGAVLFFELLDEHYNEIQRMRSVVQLQPGEFRSCIGCHEDRASTSIRRRTIASQKAPKPLVPSPWGVGAFDYQKVVQPVLDRNCLDCHTLEGSGKVDLSGTLDKDFVPASFKTLIRGGYVHHFHWGWNEGIPTKAEPYTFGSLKSRIWPILDDENHKAVKLNAEEERAIKCWIDLSCPLWPDYKQRSLRGDPTAHDGTSVMP